MDEERQERDEEGGGRTRKDKKYKEGRDMVIKGRGRKRKVMKDVRM
jgi:hypothetical protein